MNYWIWYSTLTTLTPIQKKKLLDIYETPKAIFKAEKEDLANLNFLQQSNVNEIFQKRDIDLLYKYEKYISKNNIHMLNITDKDYPEKLKRIYDPPITLFLRGNIKLLNSFSIAMIGCRNATPYGINIAKTMAHALANKNVVIVSGMARGIDGASHMGALMSNKQDTFGIKGKTIAVLGSGVDYPYPSENLDIYKSILQNQGLIVSEYIVGTRPLAKNFPQRNRIISALSEGVLVVEAKRKSGTMITVDFALEQGKNVYTIPGNINSANSEGTNDLIKQGAKLVSSIEDILEDFTFEF